MKILNSEVILHKNDLPETLNSQCFEAELSKRGFDFIRWAIVNTNANDFVLNVSHKVKD